MRLSEELARVLPARRRRRPVDQAPREIVPREGAIDERPTRVDPFDAARDRLRAEIPAPDDDH